MTLILTLNSISYMIYISHMWSEKPVTFFTNDYYVLILSLQYYQASAILHRKGNSNLILGQRVFSFPL